MGNDFIDGNDGYDVIDYSSDVNGAKLNCYLYLDTKQVKFPFINKSDQFTNIEMFLLTGHNDTVYMSLENTPYLNGNS
jgi:hypothetical protein